jgi:pimeloyl-ACP methyl ester carboxylesterase
VLILHGTDDALSPVVNATALVEHLPNAELCLMEGIGHSPNVEDPAGFNDAIRRFLKGP